jgi:hypothetical protein
MLTYNALTAGYLGYLQLGGESVGRLLLPAVVLHALFALLFDRILLRSKSALLGDRS